MTKRPVVLYDQRELVSPRGKRRNELHYRGWQFGHGRREGAFLDPVEVEAAKAPKNFEVRA
jgi:hypothetical protein